MFCWRCREYRYCVYYVVCYREAGGDDWGCDLFDFVVVLAVAYVLFKKKYYHFHKKYLDGLKKA